jgi:hypothetical protein
VGLFLPQALVLVGMGLVYSGAYCMTCALQARLDDLLATEGAATWLQRLRWRMAIAWLNFLEPMARDWGRLKGGLTPWRSALPEARSAPRASAWWQRLQPFSRSVRWAYRGNPAMEKYAFLERLTKKLIARGCAVGWNPESEDWDVKARRGALGEARLRMVVEHHGGAKRLGRLSALIRPSRSVYWAQGALAIGAAALAALDLDIPLAVVGVFMALLWVAPIGEANRLEAAIQAAAEDALSELGPVVDTARLG